MKKRMVLQGAKRLGAALLTGALAVSLLAGCGNSQSETEEESTKTEASQAEDNGDDDGDGVTTIKVGILSDSPKAAFINDDGELDGFEVNMLQAIDEVLPQYEIEFVQMDGTALFASLDAGKVDFVAANLRRSAAREEKYIHTYRSYIYTPYALMTLKENGELNTLADYEGKTIGTGDGSLMVDIIEQYIDENDADINLAYVTDSVGELVAGRIDGMAWPRARLKTYQETYPDLDFYVADTWMNGTDECMKDANAYYWMRSEDTQLRDDLSEAVYELRENGTILELCEKWYDTDYISDIDVDCEKELIENYGITDYKE